MSLLQKFPIAHIIISQFNYETTFTTNKLQISQTLKQAKPHIITETHIQTRKLHTVSVFVSYPPFFNSIFRQANPSFSQNRQYPTPFYLSVLYYHGNPRLLRDSILLPDSTIFAPIAPLSAASKNQKSGVHHPP